jgi:hypothetical protein
MALTAEKKLRTKANPGARHNTRPVAADAVIYLGALLALDADGFVVPAADAAGLKPIGFAEKSVDNTGGADGDLTVPYVTGVSAELVNAAGAIGAADVYAFAEADNEATDYAGSTNKNFLGPVEERTATLVWVFVDEAIIMSHYASNQYSDTNDT